MDKDFVSFKNHLKPLCAAVFHDIVKPDLAGRLYENPLLAVPIGFAVRIRESSLSVNLVVMLYLFG